LRAEWGESNTAAQPQQATIPTPIQNKQNRGYVLYLTYKTVLAGGGTADVWAATELPLKVSQTAAILEVVHAATGLVRSPVGITAMQVASRIWCLWGIVNAVPVPTTTSGLPATPLGFIGPVPLQLNLISLLTAWCLSEVIRYGFFALKEAFGDAPYVSTWLRCVRFCVFARGCVCPCGWGGQHCITDNHTLHPPPNTTKSKTNPQNKVLGLHRALPAGRRFGADHGVARAARA
jgi:hypothetical protein